jgi:hypothetical protein
MSMKTDQQVQIWFICLLGNISLIAYLGIVTWNSGITQNLPLNILGISVTIIVFTWGFKLRTKARKEGLIT